MPELTQPQLENQQLSPETINMVAGKSADITAQSTPAGNDTPSVQKRISTLVAKRHAAEQRAQDAERRAQELEKEVSRRKLGIASLADDVEPDVWRRNRESQILSAEPARFDATETEKEAFGSAAHKPQQSDEHAEETPPQSTDVLPPDHPHRARMQEAVEYYGPEKLQQLASAAREAGIDVVPGVARQIADLENSVDVAIAIAQEPNVALWLNDLPKSQAAQALQKISQWVANGPQAAESKPKTKAPPLIQPVNARASGAFDVNDDSMDPNEWAAKRTAQRRAQGFAY
jgi:hypothetical protein